MTRDWSTCIACVFLVSSYWLTFKNYYFLWVRSSFKLNIYCFISFRLDSFWLIINYFSEAYELKVMICSRKARCYDECFYDNNFAFYNPYFCYYFRLFIVLNDTYNYCFYRYNSTWQSVNYSNVLLYFNFICSNLDF